MSVDSRASTFDVAVCQLTSVDDVEANLRTILGLLQSLEAAPPDLVCFPENSLYLRIREGTKVPALTLDAAAFREIAKWCARVGSHVHLGSVPLARGDEAKLFNASILISPDGSVRDVYRKIHLFDVDVVGHKPMRESDSFAPGDAASVFEIKGWKFGSTICYDLRFAELFLKYAQAVDAILIPSAFLVPTGRAHWEVLTRARAIEGQAYVLAAAQGGSAKSADGAVRKSYGHSMVIDPWGEVVQTCEDGVEGSRVLRATLDRARIESVRSQIPMKNHRRL